MTEQKYTWIPDLPDHRDFKYPITTQIDIPSKIDLSPLCSPIEQQASLGSCTGNAIVGMMEYLENYYHQTPTNLSRLFVYYNERSLENTIQFDSGAMLRDGIKSLATKGICTEDLWPYDISKFTTEPSPECYADAEIRVISEYYRLETLDEMKHCLASGFPFVFGFSVFSSFESDEVARTGILNLPTPYESMNGGHAVMAVGFDDSTKRYLIRNSWGVEWGMNGYFTIPEEYLANRNLSDDFWTVRK
jgi:C1A family cysteine protease